MKEEVVAQLHSTKRKSPFLDEPILDSAIQLRCTKTDEKDGDWTEHLVDGYLDALESPGTKPMDAALNFIGSSCQFPGCKGKLEWRKIRDSSRKKPPRGSSGRSSRTPPVPPR